MSAERSGKCALGFVKGGGGVKQDGADRPVITGCDVQAAWFFTSHVKLCLSPDGCQVTPAARFEHLDLCHGARVTETVHILRSDEVKYQFAYARTHARTNARTLARTHTGTHAH